MPLLLFLPTSSPPLLSPSSPKLPCIFSQSWKNARSLPVLFIYTAHRYTDTQAQIPPLLPVPIPFHPPTFSHSPSFLSTWFLGCNILHGRRKQPTQLWLREHAKSFELLGFWILLCYFTVFVVMKPCMTAGLMGCGISLCAARIHIIYQAASIIHQTQS